MNDNIGTVIIGAGIIGAAVAYSLRNTDSDVIILEAAERVGMGISSRNSGVVHAGIYYPPDSLKTRLCREGRELLFSFATRYGVPIEKTGKYIVANDDQECAYLDWLKTNAGKVPLHLVRELPAGVRAQAVLFSPNTGVIDVHRLLEALLHESRASVLTQHRVSEMAHVGNRVRIKVNGENFHAERVINCAGLQAAGLAGGKTWYARGSYFQVRVPDKIRMPHLVYPAVPKRSASLGVHFTRNLQGEAYLGPDIEWIDQEYYAVDESRRDIFFSSAKRYLPWLEPSHLLPGYAGIRPKLKFKDFCDFTFRIEGDKGRMVHCLGIESPGLTAALAIGDHVAKLIAA